jgi:hypothetical protein
MAWGDGGHQVLVGDFYSTGTGNDTPFSEQINSVINASRGNYVLDTADGLVTVGANTDLTTSNNHIAIAGGYVEVGGDSFAINAAAAGVTNLAILHGAMSSGQARYVLIYVDSGGDPQQLAGDIATDGEQEPPETPEDCATLALIYLTRDDETMDANQIADWRFFNPYRDNRRLVMGGNNNYYQYHTASHFYARNLTGSYILLLGENFRIQDDDDSDVTLFDFSTGARTLDIGGASDEVLTTFYGDVVITNADYLELQGPSANFRLYTDGANDFSIEDVSAGIVPLLIPNGGGGGIYNRRDSAGFFTGAGDDLRFYHNGSHSFIYNGTGSLYIDVTTGNHVVFDVGGSFYIRDTDDSDADLMIFDTSGRTLTIGNSGGSDDVDITFYGSMFFEDTSHYLLATATNWGLYWDTTSNRMEFHGGGTSRFEIDLDGGVYLPEDNTGYYVGASSAGRYYDDGTNVILQGTSRNVYVESVTSGTIVIRSPAATTGEVQIQSGDHIRFQDRDDSNATLMVLYTGTRTLTIGGASDDVDTTIYGDFTNITGGSFLIQDADDSDVTLFTFNTSTRDMTVGSTGGSDDVDITLYGDFDPGDDLTHDMGSGSMTWNYGYFEGIRNRSGGTMIAYRNSSTAMTYSIEPVTDSAYGLGDATYQWVDVWADDTSINSSPEPTKRIGHDLGRGHQTMRMQVGLLTQQVKYLRKVVKELIAAA